MEVPCVYVVAGASECEMGSLVDWAERIVVDLVAERIVVDLAAERIAVDLVAGRTVADPVAGEIVDSAFESGGC